MQFLKLATALSILSVVSAETVYVTQTHLTTIQGGDGQAGTTLSTEVAAPTGATTSVAAEVKAPKSVLGDGEGSTQSAAPTTLVSKTSSAAETASSTESDSSSSGSGVSGVEDEDFAKAILKAHNEKRADHNVDALSWDSQVYKYAQDYADQYDCSGTLTHSGGEYGENLALGYNTAEKAVNAWYEEGNDYDYSSSSSFDHFTQIIWKDTTKLGCAYKDCSSAGKYIVCSYDPAGNVVGEGKANLSS
ncbi:uncharacterized protein AC631_00548 [Debaryomyces fabryi]|uniref:SCP domain-containing protein n=1 Tax=Debaryomyces fabryi TaxID=58627 RepID=A0A0V1Q5G8_9ASCO|nr:uncharacterized protein AC631_00548 [Debaryomyces fabryi]KSA03736.1 hypothetical protein AC631_00548 [Debaryomyces fabryi]CUM53323.1 unnamed protein product [Debaryomyces fabryi]